ncbi:hypothetical protein L207DRAFT_584494 [Hyaloscypha variabilis F]|uniref:Uncharacterized protein n=1 Tax=Hyaloscypha variabilis (strain UAMH 11265 / GT02V1 / F) TaxID=1149755 RepID=A0A2J6RKU2_HYAVF|nr:hypothetical protein L207DRAFT_584494 [Hyaloscypha variabilis F]
MSRPSPPHTSSVQNGAHAYAPPPPPPRAQTTPLTLASLRRLQTATSNIDTYLHRDQNFERVPLGLTTQRRCGQEIIREFDERWRIASGGAASA